MTPSYAQRPLSFTGMWWTSTSHDKAQGFVTDCSETGGKKVVDARHFHSLMEKQDVLRR
ncbi:hypothetical protein EXN66_Car021195 [Channa argus]|uniref:Uncharacterized protein n=1 Tax=Channa argus TaxID=215402 RepID=A0A6G1QSN3_CHAAH|nr:hypothetical protein EXN66_Car021195 [Channa argus]